MEKNVDGGKIFSTKSPGQCRQNRSASSTTVSGSFLESTDHSQVVSLMNRQTISSLNQGDNSIVPKNDRTRRQEKLSNRAATPLPIIIRGKFHLRAFLKVVFGFVEHQKITTYGLRYKLTSKKNTVDDPVKTPGATANTRCFL